MGPNYLEVDLDIHSYTFLLRKAAAAYHTRLRSVVWENAFVLQVRRGCCLDTRQFSCLLAPCVALQRLKAKSAHSHTQLVYPQGNATNELPEQVLGCTRIYRTDMDLCRPLAEYMGAPAAGSGAGGGAGSGSGAGGGGGGGSSSATPRLASGWAAGSSGATPRGGDAAAAASSSKAPREAAGAATAGSAAAGSAVAGSAAGSACSSGEQVVAAVVSTGGAAGGAKQASGGGA